MLTFVGVLAGNAILAFTVTAFIVPHGIIIGGATGMGLAITHYVPVNLSGVVFVINIILFLLGTFTLGKRFLVTTVLSTFVYPILLSVMRALPGISSLTGNRTLATIYAGALLGLGTGLVLRVGASTGGTDILALVFHKWSHVSVAVLLYLIDFIVLGVQVSFSDGEQVLCGLLALSLNTVLLKRVMLMGRSQIQLFIVSDHYEQIRRKMLKELDAGVTMLHVETGYDKRHQKGVLCVVPNRKLYLVNEMVQAIDPGAFITITQINEVRGRGFTIDRIQ